MSKVQKDHDIHGSGSEWLDRKEKSQKRRDKMKERRKGDTAHNQNFPDESSPIRSQKGTHRTLPAGSV